MQAKSFLDPFSKPLIAAILQTEQRLGKRFFLTGGTVRDWLLGRKPADLDITLSKGAVESCRELIRQLGGGAFVLLGTENEEAARVVWNDTVIDFSNFRKGAQSIEEDLLLRDFSINAMALTLENGINNNTNALIDPSCGKKDLELSVLRSGRDAFIDDPLRMLRGFRLSAELGFVLDAASRHEIGKNSALIQESAAERIQYELEKIMGSGSAAKTFAEMADVGILWQIFPELKLGLGMEQPGYHHEDVFYHNLLALESVDLVIRQPKVYFLDYTTNIKEYLEQAKRKNILRWSALFHDLGKPATHSSGTIKPGRTTFYNHDQVGKALFEKIAARLRWSSSQTQVVGKLIELHMHPFHLANVKRKGPLSKKSCLKICKKSGDDLAGLFVLAMADSLAGQGELKPENMEKELAQLFDEVQHVNEELIQPALCGKRLVSGHDLIEKFNLSPGPLFSKIFEDLELAMVEKEIQTRSEALEWVGKYIEK